MSPGRAGCVVDANDIMQIPPSIATRLTLGGRLTDGSGLPEMDVARVRRWCRARVAEHARDEVRVEADVTYRHLMIVECRPPWRADFGPKWTRLPIARCGIGKTVVPAHR